MRTGFSAFAPGAIWRAHVLQSAVQASIPQPAVAEPATGEVMARSRRLRPGFFTNEELCSLPPLTRLLFAGLWTLADREGRLLDQPGKIKAQLFPCDRRFSVERGLAQLAAKGFVLRYSSDTLRLLFIHSWYRHQTPHPREELSKLPPPPSVSELENGQSGPPSGTTQGMTQGAPIAHLSSSSYSFNSLTPSGSTPQTPQGGLTPRRRKRGPIAFDEDGPRFEQRVGADGKREWVEVTP